jgi:hypothetical protein
MNKPKFYMISDFGEERRGGEGNNSRLIRRM